MTAPPTNLVDSQIEYYRARAHEYDQWWQRTDRYDHGADAADRWWSEVAEVERILGNAGLGGDILELACGTGWWTQRLARMADRLRCVDASPEVIAINRARLDAAGLRRPDYETADLFAWKPAEKYQAVFFSFWLSHVPDAMFESFWATVAQALKSNGRVFFIDSARAVTRGAASAALPADVQLRQLNDGREFPIVKVFYKPEELQARLQSLGWTCEVGSTQRYFIHGLARHTG